LPFVKYLTPITGSFKAGNRPVSFELGNLHVKTATLICFEDVFPQLARHYADDDTDFLVNLTNDGWFGESAEQWQQAAAAIFRAVENGLPLVRCCNNGLTCWVDATGQIRQIFTDATGSVYGQGFVTWRIPVLMPGEQRAATFYNRHGDWFGWSCVAITAILLGWRFMRRDRQKSKLSSDRA
ncbi:MAG TPA: nitrilase-related carbon-nitrogen hydrolase, partial [Verrucomicrobiae bacterium]|nr:nitrilase-related carbon-nitrogen hydrolase [Verrucomicrobiae bacterium]